VVVSDFRSLRGDIVFGPFSARQSPAAKIPFQTRRGELAPAIEWVTGVQMTATCRGNSDFAVKPRAFGAPQAALGLDRSAQPSKRAVRAANAIW
jgi:hypothetical protein